MYEPARLTVHGKSWGRPRGVPTGNLGPNWKRTLDDQCIYAGTMLPDGQTRKSHAQCAWADCRCPCHPGRPKRYPSAGYHRCKGFRVRNALRCTVWVRPDREYCHYHHAQEEI